MRSKRSGRGKQLTWTCRYVNSVRENNFHKPFLYLHSYESTLLECSVFIFLSRGEIDRFKERALLWALTR